jgi:AcrR family transcriptional regulator
MGSLDRRRRQKELTRSNILEAAFTIIKKEGWESLTMRKIADSIEYTATAIYAYFPS